MKYIRTKDGIYKIKDLFPPYYIDKDGNEIEIPRNSAIYIDFESFYPNSKVANTIEELCDEFVCWVDDKVNVFMDLTAVKLNTKYFSYDKIYGAIWTDKGLIYVAKMNDKGELKLL